MRLLGFCGYSGAGKTTLIERLVPLLQADGSSVSVIKHAHHGVSLDKEGSDSWRHRHAGAREVLVASDHLVARIRGRESGPLELDELLAELSPCDWVLVEGFRHAAIPKVEVWRAAAGHPWIFPGDPHVVALCSDAPPVGSIRLPCIRLDDLPALAGFLQEHALRFER